MRPIYIFLALAGVGIIGWLALARPAKKIEVPKQEALAVSHHSAGFNTAIDGTLSAYEKLAEVFVAWDSSAATAAAKALADTMASLPLEELKKDSGGIFETASAFVETAKGELQTIEGEKSIRGQREAFHNLTDNLYQFLHTVAYDREKLYLQECPMAFDDTQAAQWISRKKEIRNPYLGLHHPTYGKAMLACGETKQTFNHTGKDQ